MPAWRGKKAPARSTYTGRRALQLIRGVTKMVMSRLWRLSMVRDDMMAGTLHPKPIIRGINDLPCSPILCISLSIIKAARAIYPVSSITEMNR